MLIQLVLTEPPVSLAWLNRMVRYVYLHAWAGWLASYEYDMTCVERTHTLANCLLQASKIGLCIQHPFYKPLRFDCYDYIFKLLLWGVGENSSQKEISLLFLYSHILTKK